MKGVNSERYLYMIQWSVSTSFLGRMLEKKTLEDVSGG